jgi:hypothetical protein
VTSAIRQNQNQSALVVQSSQTKKLANAQASTELEPDETLIDESTELESVETVAVAGRYAGVKRKVRSPKIVETIDLEAGDMPFSEFVEHTDPQTQMEKVLVAVAWYKEYGGIPEATVDHVYTCFKLMNWTDMPKDFGVPLSDLQRKKGFLSKGARGAWKLNHIGDNEVQKMKERAAAQTE